MSTSFKVIIVAAGKSTRFGADTPKQYLLLNGKPLLQHSIDVFDAIKDCAHIYVAVAPEHDEHFKPIINQYTGDKISLIEGGAERYESVYNALTYVDCAYDDIILIHDAARPFITAKAIDELIKAVHKNGAATLATPIVDTLKYSKKDDRPDRQDLYALQTPQGFKYGIIKAAHEEARSDLLGYQGITDDTSLVQKLNHDVQIVPNTRLNFKVTESEDFMIANLLLGQNKKTKMATGYDVHAFEEYEVVGNQIKLGGINIPHKYELKGHSDADVVLHAITDAIYGLLSDGDIGMHFPPSNAAHKNQDSADFIIAANKSLNAKNGQLTHVDVTIICENPAIGPHRDKMRKNIAKLLNMSIEDVSVKATTTEGLGFTGRREGIAVQAATTAEFSEAV